jgi:hypothetical protein
MISGSDWNRYLQRFVPLPDGVAPAPTTGAVLKGSSGSSEVERVGKTCPTSIPVTRPVGDGFKSGKRTACSCVFGGRS